jgi:hypothetical protein
VVFDACRNTLKLMTAGSRALVQSKGFVPVNQESGMLIAYATAPSAAGPTKAAKRHKGSDRYAAARENSIADCDRHLDGVSRCDTS